MNNDGTRGDHNTTRPDMESGNTRGDHNGTTPEIDRGGDSHTKPTTGDLNTTRPEIGNGNAKGEDNSTRVNTETSLDINLSVVPFAKAMPISPLAKYKLVDGTKVFNMDINESEIEFFNGIKTKTYGINMSELGETIKIHRGDTVSLVYNNNLKEPTTMHGHGMHVPAIEDGGPLNKIQPGQSWSADYEVNQVASTNWYHPHLMGKTAEHVYMRLAGFIIVEDEVSDALDIPKEYGIDDFPIVLQDRRFDNNGQIYYNPSMMEIRMGYKGPYMLVNGEITPHLNVLSKKIRLRLLNGSNSSLYDIAFRNDKKFYQIATDGGFLEEPVELSHIVLSPGERAEIVVDFYDDFNKSYVLYDKKSGKDFMKINANKNFNGANNQLPSILATLEKLDSNNAIRTRKFILNMKNGHMAINGKTMDMARIDEKIPLGDVEIWEITNMMNMEHNFHIHATHFYPISRNGSGNNILPNERGYKDVIRLAPHDKVKVIIKMIDYVDPNHGYMYHCHYLEHEDDGIMGQFSVTNGEVAVNVGENSGISNNEIPDGMGKKSQTTTQAQEGIRGNKNTNR